MVRAREVGEVMLAAFAIAQASVPARDECVRDLVGPAGIYEPDLTRWEHPGNRAPSRRDDRQVMRKRFDQRKWLALVRVRGGKTKHVGLFEERVLPSVISETDVTDETGLDRGRLRKKRFLVPPIRKTAGDEESKCAGLASIRHGESSERIENSFGWRALAQKQNLRGRAGGADGEWRITGICDAVTHDGDFAWHQRLRVSDELGSEDDRQVRTTEQLLSQPSLRWRGAVRQPRAEADAVPVEDEAVEKGSTQRHHDPVAIEWCASAGGGDVIKIHWAVSHPQGERVNTRSEEDEEFSEAPGSNVHHIARQADVDVKNFQVGCDRRQALDQSLHH